MLRVLGVLAGSAVLMAAATTYGGWAVITVEDTPTQLEANQPTRIAFTILQHGVEPMRDLRPTVTLTPEGARRGAKVRAEPGTKAGQYVATITPEAAGTVRISIDANWRDTRITLLPIQVVARVAQASAPTDVARGRQLFVAKGCVTCHAKRDDGTVQEQHVAAIGPELTGRTWPDEWLAAKLADPSRSRVGSSNGNLMPDLGLSQSEIAALVGYLNQAATLRSAR